MDRGAAAVLFRAGNEYCGDFFTTVKGRHGFKEMIELERVEEWPLFTKIVFLV